MKNDISDFGKEIKIRLIQLNMTQRALAKKIGVSENYLTDIVNGRRSGIKYRAAITSVLYKENIEDRIRIV
ncbi:MULTISPECIES: helix-turn-helix domain-containing protein [Clostridium]|jgi:transcriptional regulator with XRE-family HTH domain|uniref:Plasmid maintenance system antidote protein n=1 Tax=Clostridium saccharoperbutylacetonicum N1-4(HMT) TaxID=931276 RepID=M1MG23_9CLOT|nr:MULTISPECIES: helix-turn-helix domain-containing protein [Clostridium]AGF53926.1 plasmid maintenance system antidote protein [Clostridium saccharoperbutylacetonicum N1-4(HMT)]AQR92830.1 helix-turn-helix protein [Clostridium saccharoperbutylacetonicum]NRT59561.1 transcriptional regulator with XRE-family HTH domain [Clostridium saccharoperbutylacetonicum]NSB28753.1 transcriptional regulator with XRE-family HTH domain [Clostridium saccharoperbutylacetonicum]NSB34241.1 transcriptional regulator